jgi:23S rRNA pseudouridine1911/1915/1917 synthase
LQRQFLHAYRLGLTLPGDGTWREFASTLPEDLALALAKLRRAAGQHVGAREQA